MQQEAKSAIPTTDADGQVAYEAPRVETVLTTTDLEREVMQGLISQQM